MINIGITGQSGFIGTHLFNFMGTKSNINRILFEDDYFDSSEKLRNFVRKCDVIVHLAAINRHSDENILYKTNILLVEKLIKALEQENVTPHILFSSSIQEKLDNPYGRSKKKGRELLIQWAKNNNARFTGLIIPNVFGPFGLPFYNSVVATFCYQLTHGEKPKIEKDGTLNLIYSHELCDIIYSLIISCPGLEEFIIPYSMETTVSELLVLLKQFEAKYFEKGIIPSLENSFKKNLFNTYRSFIDKSGYFPKMLDIKTDNRGSFIETIKLETGGQVSYSTTKPGITRGNHFHTRKIERFIVLKGEALIQLRKIGSKNILEFNVCGEKPSYIDIPIWYSHNIKNVGKDELLTLFWIDEIFSNKDPDTFFEIV